ncbi:DsbA family protein [Flavihumibacter solisilvae]|uniref:Thioredoxin-like fold domain-containing protein n=1 Tax=Flavihumibacter solisilvae TaxID=1349421 RepID=A0A0C1LAS9_9BACT|nr:DsbA family protein [Flavihumibacter solisilvae]KIC92628.1 hypothetical protein OI18_21855 [Flavihumibacter solisilvae]
MLQPELDSSRDHISGNGFATITLIEYGDFQCPHCAEVYPEIKMLQEVMGDQLKFAFRHYPLQNLHPLALEAAVVTEAAAQLDRFWYMHDLIFENQLYLSRASLLRFAEELDIDTSLFTDPVEYKKRLMKVVSDFESGVRSGVSGTPTFFVNGLKYNGMPDFNGLLAACNISMLSLEAG